MNMLIASYGHYSRHLFQFALRRVGILSIIASLLFVGIAEAQTNPEPEIAPQPAASAVDNADESHTNPKTLELDKSAPLANQVETLKQAAIELNRDLLILEEDLLFPGNTQVSVFVSMNVGKFFQLDALKVKIDDKVVGSHLYTDKQVDALFRGGIQRIYVGNIKSGEHEISAFFTGRGPEGREFKRAAKLKFVKSSEPSLLEVRVVDSKRKIQPVFFIKEWQL